MKKIIYHAGLIAAVSVSILITISSGLPAKESTALTNKGQGFVVMELFTSQGCSSCPPADEILAMYAAKHDEHIIPLAFHVDYWNRLGWIDSFSQNIYSQRQRDYADKLNTESVYTPQVIINGQTQMIGSNKNEIEETITSYLKEKTDGKIEISSTIIFDKKVKVEYTVSDMLSNSVINAALVQKNITTYIRAGENRGLKLDNYNVVRDFKSKKLTATSGNFILDLPDANNTENYMVVLFVQDAVTGNIKMATTLPKF